MRELKCARKEEMDILLRWVNRQIAGRESHNSVL